MLQASLDTISAWAQRLRHNRDELEQLLESIGNYVIASPVGDFESMTEYDRQRVTLESLMERVISTIIEVTDTRRILDSVVLFLEQNLNISKTDSTIVEFQQLTTTIFTALIQGDCDTVRALAITPRWFWHNFLALYPLVERRRLPKKS